MNMQRQLRHEMSSYSIALSFDDILLAARRQFWLPVLGAALGGAFGILLIATTPPAYTAVTHLIIDLVELGGERAETKTFADRGPDTRLVDTQVEVLRSEHLARSVAYSLALRDDADFLASRRPSLPGRVVGTLRAMLALGGEPHAKAIDLAILTTLRTDTRISRLGETYIIQIAFTDPDPDRAAAIANGFAAVYLRDMVQSRISAADTAGAWVNERADILRASAYEADLAARRFREENDLIVAGDVAIEDTRLTEIDRQVAVATEARLDAEMRWRRLQAIVDAGPGEVGDATISDNQIIADLRIRANASAKRLFEIEAELGADHIQANRLRAEVADYEKLIFEELQRVTREARGEMETARDREQVLRARLGELERAAKARNNAQARLADLERETATTSLRYMAFLEHMQSGLLRLASPLAGARVMGQAVSPSDPSHPRKSIILGLALLAGAAMGTALSVWREIRRRHRPQAQ